MIVIHVQVPLLPSSHLWLNYEIYPHCSDLAVQFQNCSSTYSVRQLTDYSKIRLQKGNELVKLLLYVLWLQFPCSFETNEWYIQDHASPPNLLNPLVAQAKLSLERAEQQNLLSYHLIYHPRH